MVRLVCGLGRENEPSLSNIKITHRYGYRYTDTDTDLDRDLEEAKSSGPDHDCTYLEGRVRDNSGASNSHFPNL